MASRIGLLGGTFDPPHLGHLILAQDLSREAKLDRVLFIPAWHPPHKLGKTLTDADHRRAMVELAIRGNEAFDIDNWELNQAGPSYTVDTVAHFQDIFPHDQLFWLIGSDSLGELPTWRDFEKLAQTVDILTAHRGGVHIDAVLAHLSDQMSPAAFGRLRTNIIRTPSIEISSSDIRNRLSRREDIRYLVPEAVRQYILQEGLYPCSP